MKILNIDKYIGITPLAIIGFGGSFILLSLANEGIFIRESLLIFIWGVLSSFIRQTYKDRLAFLVNKGNGKYGDKHKNSWVIYYFFQGVMFITFTYLIFYQSVLALEPEFVSVEFVSVLNWSIWTWPGWEAISVLILLITAIAIFWQAKETKKYTRYSVMPNAWFKMKGENFIIQNKSRFPIYFAVDINLIGKDVSGNKVAEVLQGGYWLQKPLFVYGDKDLTLPPAFLQFNKFSKVPNFTQKGKVYASIKYCYWPVFAPEEKSQVILDNSWSFDFSEKEWTGPNGAKEENIN